MVSAVALTLVRVALKPRLINLQLNGVLSHSPDVSTIRKVSPFEAAGMSPKLIRYLGGAWPGTPANYRYSE